MSLSCSEHTGFRIEDNTGRFYFDAEGQERRADRDALDRPF